MFKHILLLFISVVFAGCNLAPTVTMSRPTPMATLPNIRIVAQQVTPESTRDLRPIVTETPSPTPQPTVTLYTCDVPKPAVSSQYTVVANVNYADKTVDVAQSVVFTNLSNQALTDLVLNIQISNGSDVFQIGQVRSHNVDLPFTLQLNRLTVTLPAVLEPTCRIQLDLTFRVKPPRIGSGISAFQGYFGYNERQLNLGYWLPSIAYWNGEKWVTHEAISIGEQVVLEQADWDVTVNVSNVSDSLMVVAPGNVSQPQPNQWHFQFVGGRDFAMTLSESYRVLTQTTASGAIVEVYAFGDSIRPTASGNIDGAQHALDEVVKAFQQYESLYGLYPFGRFAVVQGDFPDGMEFSGLVFVSTNWFYQWEGGFDNYLTLIAVHETAHQWWYAQVGNDSALYPWLDEALATYSEYVYYEEFHPELKDWWWSFRVGYYAPQGNVDSTVYEFASPRDYINAIYLRGVQMLQNLRNNLGTDAFFAVLAEYAKQEHGQIATPSDFWAILTAEQLEATVGTRSEFLRDPSIGQ